MFIEQRSAGFTLIELLIVVTIIAILAVMRLPVLGRTKEGYGQIYCLNNLQQLQLAIIMYTGENPESKLAITR
jgi:prepilin-type N-terminal cleavage/methylation domain-containing protein